MCEKKCLSLHREIFICLFPFYGVGNNRFNFMKRFVIILLRCGKLLAGFTRTIVEFESRSLADSYALRMKKDYTVYGCTSVKVEEL